MITTAQPEFHPLYDAVLRENSASSRGTVPSAAHQSLQNAVIRKLIRDGQWALIDALWLFATDGSDGFSRINLKNPTANYATKVGSPTFTSKKGWKATSLSNYVNLNFNPSAGTNFLANDNSFYLWRYENLADAGVDFGGQQTISSQFRGVRFRSSTNGASLNPQWENGGGESSMSGTYTQLSGSFGVKRTSTTSISTYQFGNLKGSATVTTGVMPNLNLYLGCQNLAGSPANVQVSTNISVIIFGSSALDMALVETTIAAYMASL